MGGPKRIVHITEDLCERGISDPQDAGNNFAVPSQKILSDFIAMLLISQNLISALDILVLILKHFIMFLPSGWHGFLDTKFLLCFY